MLELLAALGWISIEAVVKIGELAGHLSVMIIKIQG